MKCKEYIFLVSSGAIEEATVFQKIMASAHRFICVKCMSFTQNNQTLTSLIKKHNDQLQQRDHSS